MAITLENSSYKTIINSSRIPSRNGKAHRYRFIKMIHYCRLINEMQVAGALVWLLLREHLGHF